VGIITVLAATVMVQMQGGKKPLPGC
jgi:hypothetical protein